MSRSTELRTPALARFLRMWEHGHPVLVAPIDSTDYSVAIEFAPEEFSAARHYHLCDRPLKHPGKTL